MTFTDELDVEGASFYISLHNLSGKFSIIVLPPASTILLNISFLRSLSDFIMD